MNIIPTFLAAVKRSRYTRRNTQLLMQVVVLMLAVVILYGIVFHHLMQAEGRYYSPVTSVYWVLETMTTLGYGDITFSTDAGRVFTSLVLLTGILLVFIIVPFTFIETVYASWVQARNEEMARGVCAAGSAAM